MEHDQEVDTETASSEISSSIIGNAEDEKPLLDPKSNQAFVGKIEDDQILLDPRVDGLIDQLNKQRNIVECQQRQIENLVKCIGSFDRINHVLNENEQQYEVIDNETKIPFSTEPITEIVCNLEEITQVALVFDIPSFLCCLFRFVTTIFQLIIALMEGFADSYNGYLYFLLSLMFIFTYIFEILSGKLYQKMSFTLFKIMIAGTIITFLGIILNSHDGFDVQGYPYIITITGGCITLLANLMIALQLKRKGMPKSLIILHIFDFLETILIAVMLSDENFATRNISYIIARFLPIFAVILIFHGLGIIEHRPINPKYANIPKGVNTNHNLNDLVDKENMSLNNSDSPIINNVLRIKNETEDNDFPTTQNHNELTDIACILEQHQQRIQTLESSQHLATNFNAPRLIKIKGFYDNWETKNGLTPDVYTMMMLSSWTQKSFPQSCGIQTHVIIIPCPSKPWILGLSVFLVQIILGVSTLIDQLKSPFGSALMNIPISVTSVVRLGQLLTLFLAVITQTDILMSFRLLSLLRWGNNTWQELIENEKKEHDFTSWLGLILVPNLLKSIQASIVLFTTFLVIVQSDDIVDLLKDFTALFVVSLIDEMFFFLAETSYLGPDLSTKTKQVKNTTIEKHDRNIVPRLRSFFFVIVFVLFGCWFAVVVAQSKGIFMMQKYPLCPFDMKSGNISDDTCHNPKGTGSNILNCGWEGGDCIEFNERFPDCSVDTPLYLGDGFCHGGPYNTIECGWDRGDCIELNELYPNCTEVFPEKVGNNICDNNDFYNTTGCSWDGGDCL